MNIWLSIYLLGACVSFIGFLNCFNFPTDHREPTAAQLVFFCVLLASFWPLVWLLIIVLAFCFVVQLLLEGLVVLVNFLLTPVDRVAKFLLTPILFGEKGKAS